MPTTEPFNRVEDLVQKIGYSDDSIDEADLQQVLIQGHQMMQSKVGRNFVETKRVVKQLEDGDLVNTFDLKFAPVLTVDEVRVDRYEVLEESDYTLDKDAGELTINQDVLDDKLSLGEIFRVEYKPEIFKQIELWRAVEIIKNQEIVQLEDTEQVALNKNALREAKRLENMVNRRSGPGSARDGRMKRGTK